MFRIGEKLHYPKCKQSQILTIYVTILTYAGFSHRKGCLVQEPLNRGALFIAKHEDTNNHEQLIRLGEISPVVQQ